MTLRRVGKPPPYKNCSFCYPSLTTDIVIVVKENDVRHYTWRIFCGRKWCRNNMSDNSLGLWFQWRNKVPTDFGSSDREGRLLSTRQHLMSRPNVGSRVLFLTLSCSLRFSALVAPSLKPRIRVLILLFLFPSPPHFTLFLKSTTCKPPLHLWDDKVPDSFQEEFFYFALSLLSYFGTFVDLVKTSLKQPRSLSGNLMDKRSCFNRLQVIIKKFLDTVRVWFRSKGFVYDISFVDK